MAESKIQGGRSLAKEKSQSDSIISEREQWRMIRFNELLRVWKEVEEEEKEEDTRVSQWNMVKKREQEETNVGTK